MNNANAAMPRTPGVVSPTGRLEVLDGLRGYFLVKLNVGELSFVQDTPGFVFRSGLLIGMVYTGRMARRGLIATGPIMWRRALELFVYAMACVAAVLPSDMLARFGEYDNRPEFSAIYLLNFAALAYVVGWLIVAGPRSSRLLERGAGTFFNGLFRLRFLRLLGRHSLQVYAWHVLVVYLLCAWDRHAGPLPELEKNLVALAAIAALALPALWRERQALAGGQVPDRRVTLEQIEQNTQRLSSR